jgi:hypothetical protein
MFGHNIHTSHGSPGDNFLRSFESGGSRTRFSEKGIFVGGKKLLQKEECFILFDYKNY